MEIERQGVMDNVGPDKFRASVSVLEQTQTPASLLSFQVKDMVSKLDSVFVVILRELLGMMILIENMTLIGMKKLGVLMMGDLGGSLVFELSS